MLTRDGHRLHVTTYGPDDAPLTVFLAQCWTLDQHDWHYIDHLARDWGDLVDALAPAGPLVLVGTRDVLTPPSHARRIASHVRGAALTVIPDAGHMLPLERDALVSGVLIRLVRPHLQAA